jgi:hypothetical protein
MTRHFTLMTLRTRALLAVASALFSAVVLGSVVGLAAHYGEQAQVASVGRPSAS